MELSFIRYTIRNERGENIGTRVCHSFVEYDAIKKAIPSDYTIEAQAVYNIH